MTRILAAALAACIALSAPALCVGCSKERIDFSGHWVMTSFDAGSGNVFSEQQFSDMGTTAAEVLSLDLNADSSATMTSGGADATDGLTLSWYAADDDSSVTLAGTDGVGYVLPYDSEAGTLTLSYQGQAITLSRG